MNYYEQKRSQLIAAKSLIESIEELATHQLFAQINKHKNTIKHDYDLASTLLPFWKNYPPDDRGRQPRKDQIPWIEVGEHCVGDNLLRNIGELGEVGFPGLPAGPDLRYTVSSDDITRKTDGILDGYWSMTDIKSVGPRDNFDHAVMSHNQVSGSGVWDLQTNAIKNDIFVASGKRSSHYFHCSLPPLYVFPNQKTYLTVTLFIKPIYGMSTNGTLEQHLEEIKIGCIPNGLLLSGTDGYLKKYPGLLYPGKDDKKKNPKKLRARVDFSILRTLADFRVQTISF